MDKEPMWNGHGMDMEPVLGGYGANVVQWRDWKDYPPQNPIDAGKIWSTYGVDIKGI